MNRIFAIAIQGIVMLALMDPAFCAELSGVTGESLMRANHEASLIKDTEGTATLTITLSGGQVRTRKITSLSKLRSTGDSSSRLTRFDAPADVQGTTTLLVENPAGDDDVWVYLPALKKTRRILADQKKDSFMGTDLSYGDVLGFKISDWSHEVTTQSEVDGRTCTVVVSTPKSDAIAKANGYSKRESCIDPQSSLALKMTAWDLAGRPLKVILVHNLKLVDSTYNKWQPLTIEAQNTQTNSKSLIQFEDFRANVGLTDDQFRPDALDRDF